ncbi:MAG TPA: serpin family protein, partial [bacterium]|nr:serpin family protein [bacterium]
AARPGVKKVFVADHPFIFFIIEEESNLILFMGRTVRP